MSERPVEENKNTNIQILILNTFTVYSTYLKHTIYMTR